MVAKLLLPYLTRQKTEDLRMKQALDMLRQWNGTMDKDHAEPAMFEAWLYQMHALLLVRPLGMDIKEKGPFAASSIASILQQDGAGKRMGWCKTSSCDDVIEEALSKGLDMLTVRQGQDMTRWRWGREHIALLRHKVFSHLPLMSVVADLSVPSSGDYYTLDRGGGMDLPESMPFARTQGGGYRGIYDLDDPAKSRFMIATGQSGHIFSHHFGDLVPLWNDGKSFTLTGSEAELTAKGLPELVLEPVDAAAQQPVHSQ
jgi:penicillin amidase